MQGGRKSQAPVVRAARAGIAPSVEGPTEESAMCMNCGCGQPNEDHGKPANITAADLQRASEANRQSLRESAQHILESVELIDASGRDDRGRERSGGQSGAAAARGTPATES